MKLQLRRLYRKPEYTIGKLYIDGVYFCDTIEDVDRGLTQKMPLKEIQAIKVMHETAIPYGVYKVRLSMSPRFRKVLPEIMNVPGFTGVRAHAGNTQYDSSGCLILGKNTVKGKVTNSRYYVSEFIKILEKAGDNITIEITQ